AVDHPAVPLAPRPRGDRRGVRAGARLGEAPGAEALAGGQERHPALELALVAGAQQVAEAERVVGGDRQRQRAVDGRDLLDDQRGRDRVQRGAAVAFRHLQAEEAELAEAPHQLVRELARGVPFRRARRDLLPQHLPQRADQGALVLGQVEPKRGGAVRGHAYSIDAGAPSWGARAAVGRLRAMEQGPFWVRGVRGATTVAEDRPELILEATRELLVAMLEANGITDYDRIAAIFFTTTPDLVSTFPAEAARELGMNMVPLLCNQ